MFYPMGIKKYFVKIPFWLSTAKSPEGNRSSTRISPLLSEVEEKGVWDVLPYLAAYTRVATGYLPIFIYF